MKPEDTCEAISTNSDASWIKLSATHLWQKIRIRDCEDGGFCHRPDCQAWMQQLAAFVVARLGPSPRARIFAYASTGNTLLAVDVYEADTDEGINITIFLSKGIYLVGPAGDQFDIALPGVIDALSFVSTLLSLTAGTTQSHQMLWVSSQGT